MTCGMCGGKEFEVKNVKDRMSSPYMDHESVLVRVDLFLRECTACGNHILSSGDCAKLDVAIVASLALEKKSTI